MKKEENKTTKKILSLIRRTKKEKKKKKKLEEKDIKKYSMIQLDHVISKIKEQEFKYIVISVLLILMIVLTVCYIVFSSIQTSVYDSTIRSGKLLINYEEKDGNLGNIVNLTGLNNKDAAQDYVFSITNTSKEDKEYVIKITEDLEMIRVDGCIGGLINRDKIKYSYNDEEFTLPEEEIILTDVLNAGSSAYYKLKIWVDDDSFTINNHYHARISVSEK